MGRNKSSKVLLWAGLISFFLVASGLGYAVGAQDEFPPDEAFSNPSTAEAGAIGEEGTVLVKYKDSTSDAEQQKIESAEAVKVEEKVDALDTKVLQTTSGQDSHQLLSEFRQDNSDKIEYAELNGRMEPLYVPNDPEYPTQWGLPKIQAAEGWDKTKGSPGITVAVIDTGVNSAHPDLKNKLVPGFNTVYNNTDTADTHGHGTLMAGIAGAQTGNALGVAGVGIETKIMPMRISINGYAYWSDMAEAIIWAADHGAKVMSISFGGSSSSATLQSAVDYAWGKGVFIAASAGNSNSSSPSYPAAANHVVSVGATDQNDQKASFSNYGPTVDVTSPGVSIKSTNMAGSYSSVSGTSPACPFVAGLASLVLAQKPQYTSTQVESIIKLNTDDLGAAGRDDIFGWGRINANKTLAVNAPTPPPPYGNIVGKVTNAEDNLPLIGAKLSALKDGREAATATATADGSYQLVNLASGYYTVNASMEGFTPQTRTNVLVADGKTTEGVNFLLQPKTEKGTISGTVYRQSYQWQRVSRWKRYLQKTNLPASKVKVTVRMLSTPRRAATLKSTVVVRANNKGQYTVDNLPAGTYLVTASYFAGYAHKEVHLDAGENKLVDLILSRSNWPRWVKNVLAKQKRK